MNVAIVLAAGGSRRLGQSKQRVELDGMTLVERAVGVAVRAGLKTAVVVSDIEAAPRDAGVTVLENARAAQGMGTSVAAGAAWARRENAAAAVFMTCDQYLVTSDDLVRLVEARAGCDADAAAALYEGVVGVPAVFAARCFGRLLVLQGDRGARELLRGGALEVVEVELAHAAQDLDTERDLGRLGLEH